MISTGKLLQRHCLSEVWTAVKITVQIVDQKHCCKDLKLFCVWMDSCNWAGMTAKAKNLLFLHYSDVVVCCMTVKWCVGLSCWDKSLNLSTNTADWVWRTLSRMMLRRYSNSSYESCQCHF